MMNEPPVGFPDLFKLLDKRRHEAIQALLQSIVSYHNGVYKYGFIHGLTQLAAWRQERG